MRKQPTILSPSGIPGRSWETTPVITSSAGGDPAGGEVAGEERPERQVQLRRAVAQAQQELAAQRPVE
nr:hypothetical protein [uncultured bacterium]